MYAMPLFVVPKSIPTTFAIIKHNNACGLASRENLKESWKDALAGDPVSAFGGVLVTNKSIDAETAQEINKIFFEIVIAPDYDTGALEILKSKKNRIILKKKAYDFPDQQFRSLLNGALVQEKDRVTEEPADLKNVTKQKPTDTQTEDPTFAGTTSNAIVVSSSVEIDDTSGASPTGEYFFSNYIDTGSSRNARVTGYRTFERRYDDTTLLWDAIPQNWDTWPDLWDTWTNEDANFGDIGVTVYVATTNDDPAGTPTWGSWELANGSFYTGRAFKFKAVLESDNTNYTPAILTLSADVEY